MSYYFLYQKKGIPSWLAYFFILILTLSLSFVFKNKSSRIVSRASKNLVPQQVTISNITNEAATVFFITKDDIKSHIVYSSEGQAQIVKFDLRDEQGQLARKTHYFVLNQLQPYKKYTFEIYLENSKYAKKFEFQTLNKTYPLYSNAPIFGKILQSNFQGEGDVLVSLRIPKYQSTYSTISKSTGEWIVTLPFVLDNQLEEVAIDDNEPIELEFTDAKLKKTTVKVGYSNTHPLRSVILGQDYDFTLPNSILGITNKKKQQGLVTFPANNSLVKSFYPVFRGTSIPGTLLRLSLKPAELNLLVTVDNNGDWKYTPTSALSPGKYELVVIADKKTEKVNFVVGKSGEAVLGEATPSATVTTNLNPTATITSSPSPTTKPNTTQTPSPTQKITAAPTNQITPSNTPTPTKVTTLISPTITKKEIPELGLNSNLIILFASGLSLLGLYLVLY